MEDFEGYDEWLDDVQASNDADIAGEQFENDYSEAAKELAGGLL